MFTAGNIDSGGKTIYNYINNGNNFKKEGNYG